MLLHSSYLIFIIFISQIKEGTTSAGGREMRRRISLLPKCCRRVPVTPLSIGVLHLLFEIPPRQPRKPPCAGKQSLPQPLWGQLRKVGNKYIWSGGNERGVDRQIAVRQKGRRGKKRYEIGGKSIQFNLFVCFGNRYLCAIDNLLYFKKLLFVNLMIYIMHFLYVDTI